MATLIALSAGTVSALTLTAVPKTASATSPAVSPVAAPSPTAAPPVAPSEAAPTPAYAPTTTTTTTTTTRATTSTRATPTRDTERDDTGGSNRDDTVSGFCSSNPDLCTDGIPDKRSDRAEYQDDPRSNAEINSGQPMYAPEGVCPGGYARVAGVC